MVRGPHLALAFALAPAGALALALVPALAGCQQITYVDANDDSSWQGTSQPWPEEAGGPGDAGPGDDDGRDGQDEAEDDGKLDMPEDVPAPECSAVDLLFVIDNSSSMLAEQQNLIASFDGFIEGIQANLDEANDYHIGVVTTDAYAGNEVGCQSIGALVTQTEGGACGPWAQGRFISLEDPLQEAFTCAGMVGVDGDGDEHPIEAAMNATGTALAEPGACNEGFLRDDALLVLVLITDEDDGGSSIPGHTGSPGGPSTWFQDLVARKGGVESNIVVLALIGVPTPNDCDPNDPFEISSIATRLTNFVNRFTHGAIGDVCTNDYSPFFADSLAIIHDACAGFTPVE